MGGGTDRERPLGRSPGIRLGECCWGGWLIHNLSLKDGKAGGATSLPLFMDRFMDWFKDWFVYRCDRH